MAPHRDPPFTNVEEFVGCFSSLEELILLFKTNPEVKKLISEACAGRISKHECLVALTKLERPPPKT